MELNKKGFTLIELLAVIVILAIIMLIATPVIMGVIEDARQGAAKNSALGYIDAIEKQAMIEELRENNNFMNTVLTNPDVVSHRGEKPTAIELSVSNGAVTTGTITFGRYMFSVTNGAVALTSS